MPNYYGHDSATASRIMKRRWKEKEDAEYSVIVLRRKLEEALADLEAYKTAWAAMRSADAVLKHRKRKR